MNKIKKVLLVIMACAVVLLMTACGDIAFKHGYWQGQTYYSEYFGFSVKGEAGWDAMTDDGMADFHHIPDLSSKSLKSVLDKGSLLEMQLSKRGGVTINIHVYDNEKFPQYREYQYIDTVINSIEKEFGSLKTISYNAKQGAVNFLGKLTVCVETDMTIRGLPTTYGLQIPVVRDNYTASIVFTASKKEDITSALDRFSVI